ncbi:MAG: RDD family protein [Acidaminobacteraceae bacterium]
MHYRIAKPVKRLIAYLIDFSVNVGLLAAMIVVTGYNPFFVIPLIFFFGMFKLYYWTKSTTFGKSVLNMKIIRMGTESELNFFQMVLRQTVGKLLSFSILNLGFIWIIIDNENQGWHDKILDCVVIDIDDTIKAVDKVVEPTRKFYVG